MYAMAMHKGIATRTLIKDTVTPGLLQSLLKTLVGDVSYGVHSLMDESKGYPDVPGSYAEIGPDDSGLALKGYSRSRTGSVELLAKNLDLKDMHAASG